VSVFYKDPAVSPDVSEELNVCGWRKRLGERMQFRFSGEAKVWAVSKKQEVHHMPIDEQQTAGIAIGAISGTNFRILP